MKIEMANPKSLEPSAYNPRKISAEEMESLRRSIREFGLVQPLLVQLPGDRIIAGHQRREAAIAEGLTKVPVHRLRISDAKAKAMNLALNRISGEWDDEKLAALLGELQAVDWTKELSADSAADGISITGFDSDEIMKLLGQEAAEVDEGPAPQIDKAAELQKEWKTERGQVWQIAQHRLMCGDCLQDLSRLISAGHISMVFTDPPYNSLTSWKKDEAHSETRLDPARWFTNDNMSWPDYITFLRGALKIRGGHSCYICCDFRIYPLVLDASAAAGFELKHCIVWKKSTFGLGKRYRFQHEFIVYCCTKDAPFYGDRAQSDVWEYAGVQAEDVGHSTPKPVALPACAISNSSKPGEIVLDQFLGSGTTMVAAEQLGRICYGMEIEPKYVAVSLQRMADMGLKPKLVKS